MILDTNAVSGLAEGAQDLVRHLRSARTHSVPSVVLGEFRYGLARSRRREELQRWLARLEAQVEVLDVTKETAVEYAKVRNELRESGRPIPENDVWIAALARQHGLAILSRDRHFDNVIGVVRVGW